MTELRHLLVMASQCEQFPPLPLLESAAAELHEVLVDPTMGDCRPALPDGRSLCVGGIAAEQVRAEVREAVEHAATAGATLVLALLGHAFGDANDLHIMVAGSRDGDPHSSVSVSELLGDAAERAGVTGVIGIVDTRAAVPELGRLPLGRAGVALLTAAAARAWRRRVPARQGARRAAASRRAERRPGPGHAVLRTALARLTPPHANPAEWNTAALLELQRELAGAPDAPATTWALRVVDSLLVAMRTTDLLQALLPEALDTRRLRGALAAADISLPAAARTTTDVAEHVEPVCLWYPATDGSCRAQVARFVLALAGSAGKPFDDQAIADWTRAIRATVQVNDATGWARRLSRTRRPRLIVSLHASNTGDWPELLETWLLMDGRLDDGGRRRIPCMADRAGVEEAILEAIDQAEARAEQLAVELEHIDVAVPSKLLLEWRARPVARHRLHGGDPVVGAAEPAEGGAAPQQERAHRRQDMDAHVGGAPVVWLDHRTAQDLPALRQKLVSGNYRKAVALDRSPTHGERLFSLLLAR